jgi:hypothetical protein
MGIPHKIGESGLKADVVQQRKTTAVATLTKRKYHETRNSPKIRIHESYL